PCDMLVAIGMQIEEVDDLLHGLAMLALFISDGWQKEQVLQEIAAPPYVPAHKQVLQHGGMFEKFDILEGPGDAEGNDPIRPQARDVLAIEDDAPMRGIVEARYQIENGRFA